MLEDVPLSFSIDYRSHSITYLFLFAKSSGIILSNYEMSDTGDGYKFFFNESQSNPLKINFC